MTVDLKADRFGYDIRRFTTAGTFAVKVNSADYLGFKHLQNTTPGHQK